MPHKTFFQDLEIEEEFPVIGKRIILLNAREIIQKDKSHKMILLAMQDITEKKHLEQQKDDFISIASHELKTPVTSLKVYTQLLQRHPLITNDRKASLMLAKMDTQMNRLTELIASFMNVYQVQSGKLKLRKKVFQIDELLTEVVGNFQYTIESHTIEKSGEDELFVHADPEKINQVLVNIITNAIKYSPKANKVLVRLSSDSSKVIVAVQDFGIGIPNDEQSKIYQRFFRAKGKREGNIPGLGLGLFISQEIIKQHGGDIWVNSIEGEGSTFYFTLPIYKKKRKKIIQ